MQILTICTKTVERSMHEKSEPHRQHLNFQLHDVTGCVSRVAITSARPCSATGRGFVWTAAPPVVAPTARDTARPFRQRSTGHGDRSFVAEAATASLTLCCR
ncbi:hypothetical protein BN2476_1230069 [Paraburkholderia piptadeniae]|uniref:Uncharacterized protein n=1 Tax=Paraburkholderia piptadeniae TaxID=1701573 RepID=A0A1N7SW07_9BURK|nr:hypothetical protein BN2476_1230069 [Paraburkholderia piptadeniae]